MQDIKKIWTFYRVMSAIVGVLLVVLILVGVPLKYASTWMDALNLGIDPGPLAPGMGLQHLGELITTYLGVAHGWLYMVFLLSAFMLSRLAKWPMGFTVVTLLMGTVPILSFWSERRASNDIRERFADQVS